MREADREDARALGEIHFDAELAWLRECHPEGWPESWFQFRSVDDAVERFARWLDAPPPGHRYVIAEADRVPVGFWMGAPEPSFSASRLHALYVRPELWDQGIGGFLHDDFIDRARDDGFSRAVLWAVESNPRSRLFYEHRGWRLDGATTRASEGITLVGYRRKL